MPFGARRFVWLIWLCFLVRGAFYTVLLPLWEGFDEWAHFAYAQQLASGGGLLVPGRTVVSREVAESLSLTPLPHGQDKLDMGRQSHDVYWKLPLAEREELRRRLLAMPREWARQPAAGPPLNYEAQQPPLYYLLMAPIQWAAGEASLPTRVLLMRLASLLLTSLTIPLAYAAGRQVLASEGTAAGVAALIASMPGFLMISGRVTNDGERPLLVGALLGAGLLTKAYFLTAVPALAVAYAWKSRRRRAAADAAIAFLTAGAVSGWWYWRNHALTGSWSGLQQVVARRDLPLWTLAGRIPEVDWRRFFDVAFLSHIWIGNWSFLQVRSWMYRIFAWVVLAAAAGLVVRFWHAKSDRPNLSVLAGFYGFFWLGLCYHELTFSVLGLSVSTGWHVYAVVVAEALLATLGLMTLCPAGWRDWLLPAGTALFVLLDLYATHFLLLPYYTGLIAHRADGALAAFHLSQLGNGEFSLMMSRLMLPAPATVALWLGFLIATLALPVLAVRAAYNRLLSKQAQMAAL